MAGKVCAGSDDRSFYRPPQNRDITKDLFTEAGRNKGDAVSSLRQRLVLVIAFPLFAQHLGRGARGTRGNLLLQNKEHLMASAETDAQAFTEEEKAGHDPGDASSSLTFGAGGAEGGSCCELHLCAWRGAQHTDPLLQLSREMVLSRAWPAVSQLCPSCAPLACIAFGSQLYSRVLRSTSSCF